MPLRAKVLASIMLVAAVSVSVFVFITSLPVAIGVIVLGLTGLYWILVRVPTRSDERPAVG